MPPLKLKEQIKVIFASCTLHNMIHIHQKGMSISPTNPNIEGVTDTSMFEPQRKCVMKHLRDEIVDNIWKSVQVEGFVPMDTD